MALNEQQVQKQRTAVVALESLLEDFPSDRSVPEEVKKARAYCKTAEDVGDTGSPMYKKQKAIVDGFKPAGSSETRMQVVDALRYAKRIGNPSQPRAAKE